MLIVIPPISPLPGALFAGRSRQSWEGHPVIRVWCGKVQVPHVMHVIGFELPTFVDFVVGFNSPSPANKNFHHIKLATTWGGDLADGRFNDQGGVALVIVELFQLPSACSNFKEDRNRAPKWKQAEVSSDKSSRLSKIIYLRLFVCTRKHLRFPRITQPSSLTVIAWPQVKGMIAELQAAFEIHELFFIVLLERRACPYWASIYSSQQNAGPLDLQ